MTEENAREEFILKKVAHIIGIKPNTQAFDKLKKSFEVQENDTNLKNFLNDPEQGHLLALISGETVKFQEKMPPP